MANGNFGGGAGTDLEPYLVEDVFDLDAIRTKGTTLSYKLVKDIDMNVHPFNSGTGWTPFSFSGKLDGNFKTISGLFIESTGNYQGLFTYLGSNGIVKNLYLENFKINFSRTVGLVSYIGAIAGYANSNYASVENVVVKNLKIYGSSYVGGIFGRMSTNNTIKNCVVDDFEVYTNSNYVGGIVGYSENTIDNCCVDNIRLSSDSPVNATYLGGIVGWGQLSKLTSNFFNSSAFNYNGYNSETSAAMANTINNWGLNATAIKNSANFVGVGTTTRLDDKVNDKGFKAYIIDLNNLVRPRLFMEKGINKTLIYFMSDYTTLIDFGDVVEGEASSYRKVTVKVSYDVPINNLNISWVRRTGVSTMTSIEFSPDQDFATPTAEYNLTNQNLQRGDEITFYMRIKTAVGMTGDGAFDLIVDVSS
jgi:hypothetical protein